MSQPERLVLELLLQQTVPDSIDAGGSQQLVTTLESKGLRPDQHPRLAAALTALEHQAAPPSPHGQASPTASGDQQPENADSTGFGTSTDNAGASSCSASEHAGSPHICE